MSRVRAAALLAASAALVAVLSTAEADVVRPPPTDCPAGQVGVTGHGGPKCVDAAPLDCPTGWRGQLGGNCVLAPCETDANCQSGEACVEHAVCLQPFEDDYYDYGEEEREKHGWAEPHPSDILRSPGLLAGPVAPKTRRAKPIVRYNAVNLCSAEIACAAPNTCQTEKLCVPRGSRALGYRGQNISPARVARKTETPLTTSGAEPTETPSPITSTTRPGTSGCAGCTVPPDQPTGALALASAALALLALKRRRG
jgi:MYXO-CTERM domain-containing protein